MVGGHACRKPVPRTGRFFVEKKKKKKWRDYNPLVDPSCSLISSSSVIIDNKYYYQSTLSPEKSHILNLPTFHVYSYSYHEQRKHLYLDIERD